MGKTININNLSKEEINSFYDFVCDYELNIKNKYSYWNNENTKMKMQTKAILKTTICFFLFFSMFILFIFV